MNAIHRMPGKRLRCAFVVMELFDRKPLEITRIHCSMLHFISEGLMNDVMIFTDSRTGVIEATIVNNSPPEIKRIDLFLISITK